jgi:methylated-DNA-[protein]-cysteine S-methyltransferase
MGLSSPISVLKVSSDYGTFWIGATQRGIARVVFPGVSLTSEQTPLVPFLQDDDSVAARFAGAAKKEILDYLGQSSLGFKTPIDFRDASDFAKDIYRALCGIPAGQTITYGELSTLSGHPGKARAVGGAVARNPVPLIVPCHRVLAAKGLGGWSGPPGWKERLLIHEGRTLEKDV